MNNEHAVLNIMAIAMRGLRVRPQYEDLIGVAKPDGLENIKFLNRDAKIIREGCIYNLMEKAWGKCNYSKNKQLNKHLNNIY